MGRHRVMVGGGDDSGVKNDGDNPWSRSRRWWEHRLRCWYFPRSGSDDVDAAAGGDGGGRQSLCTHCHSSTWPSLPHSCEECPTPVWETVLKYGL